LRLIRHRAQVRAGVDAHAGADVSAGAAVAVRAEERLDNRRVRRQSSRPYGRFLAALITQAQTDPDFAARYRQRFVEPRRDQGRALFWRAIERGEIPADVKIEVALDLLYGPMYHRLLHGHAPLSDRFVRDVIDMALSGIQSAVLPFESDGRAGRGS